MGDHLTLEFLSGLFDELGVRLDGDSVCVCVTPRKGAPDPRMAYRLRDAIGGTVTNGGKTWVLRNKATVSRLATLVGAQRSPSNSPGADWARGVLAAGPLAQYASSQASRASRREEAQKLLLVTGRQPGSSGTPVAEELLLPKPSTATTTRAPLRTTHAPIPEGYVPPRETLEFYAGLLSVKQFSREGFLTLDARVPRACDLLDAMTTAFRGGTVYRRTRTFRMKNATVREMIAATLDLDPHKACTSDAWKWGRAVGLGQHSDSAHAYPSDVIFTRDQDARLTVAPPIQQWQRDELRYKAGLRAQPGRFNTFAKLRNVELAPGISLSKSVIAREIKLMYARGIIPRRMPRTVTPMSPRDLAFVQREVERGTTSLEVLASKLWRLDLSRPQPYTTRDIQYALDNNIPPNTMRLIMKMMRDDRTIGDIRSRTGMAFTETAIWRAAFYAIPRDSRHAVVRMIRGDSCVTEEDIREAIDGALSSDLLRHLSTRVWEKVYDARDDPTIGDYTIENIRIFPSGTGRTRRKTFHKTDHGLD